ncbi:hypothetical protein WYO_4496, partial [Methylobacterium sp. GXF4]
TEVSKVLSVFTSVTGPVSSVATAYYYAK